MIGPRFLDVILNPCLRNDKVIKAMTKVINYYSELPKMVSNNRKIRINTEEFDSRSKALFYSRLSFLELQNEVSPLFALIVFCHTELSINCLNTLQQTNTNFNASSLFPAVCCNGSISMFETFTEDSMKKRGMAFILFILYLCFTIMKYLIS